MWVRRATIEREGEVWHPISMGLAWKSLGRESGDGLSRW